MIFHFYFSAPRCHSWVKSIPHFYCVSSLLIRSLHTYVCMSYVQGHLTFANMSLFITTRPFYYGVIARKLINTNTFYLLEVFYLKMRVKSLQHAIFLVSEILRLKHKTFTSHIFSSPNLPLSVFLSACKYRMRFYIWYSETHQY